MNIRKPVTAAVLLLALLAGGYCFLQIFGTFVFKKKSRVNPHVAVTLDIKAIASQLEVYRRLNLSYPTSMQGLQALTAKPLAEPRPRNWQQLLAQLPKDPWGRQYVYLSPGRSYPEKYDLFSLGPDGIPNTADDDWGE